MKTEKVTFNSQGRSLVGVINFERWFPRPCVILLHGLTNSKYDCPLINELSEALVDAGFVVFRFDFYGSGESPGTLKDRKWSTAEQNARDAINYIESRGAKKIGLWGRSIGGTVAILCSDIPSIRAFTLATTPVLLREVFLSRFEKVRKLELELEQKGLRLPGTGHFKGEFEINKEFFEEVPSTEARVMKNLACMRRVLVLGTTPDTKVPLSNPATIMNTAKEPKKIWIFEGVDHDYKGVEEKALDLTVSWFKGYLGK